MIIYIHIGLHIIIKHPTSHDYVNRMEFVFGEMLETLQKYPNISLLPLTNDYSISLKTSVTRIPSMLDARLKQLKEKQYIVTYELQKVRKA